VLLRHLQSFLASDERGEPGYPGFVRKELYGYLDCGILASGFARVHCTSCGRDELVAFSCKGRGFCPSCGGRRMAQTAQGRYAAQNLSSQANGGVCCTSSMRRA
jgi:hypothetical protein